MKERIAVIGLGQMGANMADALRAPASTSWATTLTLPAARNWPNGRLP